MNIARITNAVSELRWARACVAVFAISNDVSERELQTERGGQRDNG
jgi:2-keto-4-pentenoate hydratase/2-oxohepta-3-ene-1,7-dioic acid hydratase in catechol pathway